MNIAVQYAIGVVENGLCLVGEDDLDLGTALADEVAVVLHVVHTGELVLVLTEQLAVLLQREDVGIGVDTCGVDLIQAHKLVTDLVRGVREHQDDLLAALCDTAQADREAVTGKDGENDTHGATAQLGLDIGGDIVHRAVVALCTSHDGLGDGNDVAVAELKALGCGSLQHAIGYDGGQIVTLADDGATDTPRNSTYFSGLLHKNLSPKN